MTDDVTAALERIADALDSLSEHVGSLETTLVAAGADEGMLYMTMSEVQERLEGIHRMLAEVRTALQ